MPPVGERAACRGAAPTRRRRLPEVAEIDLIRHFVNLSTKNMSIDTNFYPLGSCTMKYNPKRHERLAALPGLADLHPLQADDVVPGHAGNPLRDAELSWREIAGLHGVSLQPAAGAQGELTALLVAAAYFKDKGEKRTRVLIPDSAHGTNPASAAIAGFDAVTVKSNSEGLVDLADLKAKLDERTAVFMITNPNTLGLFEPADRDHHRPGARARRAGLPRRRQHERHPGHHPARRFRRRHDALQRPQDVHRPARRRRSRLRPHRRARHARRRTCPPPSWSRKATRYRLDYDRPKSIGRVRSFFGNVGILLRGYCYIRTLGPQGLREVSENAVLNANYLLSRVKEHYDVPHGDRCMHEFVASAKNLRREKRISAMDIGKRLLDFGYHAPTVYFPLVVPEALMIEPTETESKETLDAFADALMQHQGRRRRIPARGAAHARAEPARRGQGGQGAGAALEGVRGRR